MAIETDVAPAAAPPRVHRSGTRRMVVTTIAVFGLTLASRLVTAARYPTEHDSAQFVMGLDRFDVRDHTPHSPGYWLFVFGGRVVRAITPWSGHASLLVLSAVASAGTVALTYLIGVEIGAASSGSGSDRGAGHRFGLLVAALLGTSPLLWFHGSMVNTYVFDATTAALLIWLALRARPGRRDGLYAAITLGLAMGLRQTAVLVLAPIALVAIWRSGRSARQVTRALLGLAITVLLWLIPLAIDQPGGLDTWWRESRQHAREDSSRGSPLFGASTDEWLEHVKLGGSYTLFSLGPFAVVGAVALAVGWRTLRHHRQESAHAAEASDLRAPDVEDARRVPANAHAVPAERTTRLILAIAAVGPLLFSFFVFFAKSGHALAPLVPAALLLLWPARHLRGNAARVVAIAVVAVSAVSFARFSISETILPHRFVDRGGPWVLSSRYGAPFGFTNWAINEIDRQTRAYEAIERQYDPSTTVLVFVDGNGGQRYRQEMLALPEFIAHGVIGGIDVSTGQHLRTVHEYDNTIEVPRGGRALFVLDVVTPDVEQLVRAGMLRQVILPTGPSVWEASPGAIAFGVTIAESPS